jgi:hypothetical protein
MQGEQVTFKQMWRRQGGFWGFLTGFGGEHSIVGAGGRSDQAFWNGWTRWELELERHMREAMLAGKDANKVPVMSEVSVQKAGKEGMYEFCSGQDQVSSNLVDCDVCYRADGSRWEFWLLKTKRGGRPRNQSSTLQ